MAEDKKTKEFSRQEVRKLQEEHPEGCYVVVHNNVYNLTKYLDRHPGGRNLLLKNAGEDATSDFEGMFHSVRARKVLTAYQIGIIKLTEQKHGGLDPAMARLQAMTALAKASGILPKASVQPPFPSRGAAGALTPNGDFKAPLPVVKTTTFARKDRQAAAATTTPNIAAAESPNVANEEIAKTERPIVEIRIEPPAPLASESPNTPPTPAPQNS